MAYWPRINQAVARCRSAQLKAQRDFCAVRSWVSARAMDRLPKDIVARWNKEIDLILQLPDVKERITGNGMVPAGGSPEHFRELLKRDVAKWHKVIKSANIKL